MDKLNSLSSFEIVALTIFGEARGEPIDGMVAVGSVIRNRLYNSKQTDYHTICLAPEQFSCWNEYDINYPVLIDLVDKLITGQKLTDPIIKQCFWVAQGIINHVLIDNTMGAENYLTKSLYFSDKKPKWAATPKYDPITHGNQVFFLV